MDEIEHKIYCDCHPNVSVGYYQSSGPCPLCKAEERIKELEDKLNTLKKREYDLMAKAEESSKNQICIICGDSPMLFQWAEFPGEAICFECGCPYQLKWGNDEQVEKNEYPYPNILPEAIEPIKQYWNETHKRMQGEEALLCTR